MTNTDLGGPLGSRDPRLLKTDLLEKVGEARPFDQGDAGMIAQFSLDEAAGGVLPFLPLSGGATSVPGVTP